MTKPTWHGGAALDPERDEARRLLEEELGSGDYRLRESLVDRFLTWLQELLPEGWGGQLPSWATWVILGAVLVTALAVIGYAASDRWRTARRLLVVPSGSVLDGDRRTAQEYRSSAVQALARGDAGTAVLDAYRALAAQAIERTLLDDRAGRTAREIAHALSTAFPTEQVPLLTAAALFDTVRYGHHRPSAEQAQDVLDLDARLRATGPALVGASASVTTGIRS